MAGTIFSVDLPIDLTYYLNDSTAGMVSMVGNRLNTRYQQIQDRYRDMVREVGGVVQYSDWMGSCCAKLGDNYLFEVTRVVEMAYGFIDVLFIRERKFLDHLQRGANLSQTALELLSIKYGPPDSELL